MNKPMRTTSETRGFRCQRTTAKITQPRMVRNEGNCSAKSCSNLRSFSSIAQSIKISFTLAPSVINVHYFQFSVEVEGRRALLAIADAGSFNAPEGNMRL